jgi:hypothetical protein
MSRKYGIAARIAQVQMGDQSKMNSQIKTAAEESTLTPA